MFVDFESVASAKACETAPRVTVFVIGDSELMEITVKGQGSLTVTSNERMVLALSCCGVAFALSFKFIVLPIRK